MSLSSYLYLTIWGFIVLTILSALVLLLVSDWVGELWLGRYWAITLFLLQVIIAFILLNLKYWHINIHAIVEEHYEKYFHQEGEYMTNIMLMDNGEEFLYGGPLWHVYIAVYCCVL